jgi:CheY-like chemotaxis protein
VVEIKDTGSGIPAEIQGRIFDPFFTTKPASLGTGLGLSICQRIVTSVGGQIEVQSQLGNGSTFRVTLESTRTLRASAVVEVAMPVPPSAPRGRVLVIDDDPAVGSALKLVLAEEHEVTVLTSARRALDQLGAGECFDAILCDVMMPEMSGIEFHDELTHMHPDLAAQVIFLTGGAFTLRAREFLDRVPNPRMGKPFDWPALKALIHQRLVSSA